MTELSPNSQWTSRLGEFGTPQNVPHHSSISSQASAYLTPYNQRLVDLKQRYSTFRADCMTPTQWSNEYIKNEVSLQHFRGDCAYLWQRRDLNLPVHYLCTYYFQKSIPEASLFLKKCPEDDLFGAVVVPVDGEIVTRDRLDSVSELTFIVNELTLTSRDSITVLDIGSGYGRFAHRMTQCLPNAKVICTDGVPESIFLTEFYLTYRHATERVIVCPAMDLHDTLACTQVDLAVAINSLSECPSVAVRWWAELLAHARVPYVFCVPHSAFERGKQVLSCEANPITRVDIAQILLQYGYNRVSLKPKYSEPQLQSCGLSPTYYHLFRLR